ncbi:GAP family protein [Actinospica durhamensis]|uniref:GAP family protein n=1 Tax=Actinospica durhamensis TaxID=1508375 RepID=A0A941EHW8_9ACTN|nr:GAP family protein [Actinospica durhamensis]MBR7832880.1 GAP family protein [Actinospica durhamensis]
MSWEAVTTALVAAFSPWTLLVVAGLLSQPNARRLALIFLISAGTLTLAVGFAVVLALSGTGVDDPHKHRDPSAGIDVAVGVAVLAFAVFIARRKSKPSKTRREVGFLGVIVLGLTVGSPSPLYLASLHSISKSRPGALAVTWEVLLVAALVLLLAEIPVLLFLFAPERTAAALHAANGWLAVHGRAIAVGAATVVGLYFVIAGLVRLA